MAGHIITAIKSNIYSALFKDTSFTLGSSLEVALSTTIPAEDGTNFTEPVGNGYVRVSRVAADWTEPNSLGEGTNATAITFPAATGEWGLISYAGLFATTGLAAFYQLSEAIYVSDGIVVEFNPGDFMFGPWALP